MMKLIKILSSRSLHLIRIIQLKTNNNFQFTMKENIFLIILYVCIDIGKSYVNDDLFSLLGMECQ